MPVLGIEAKNLEGALFNERFDCVDVAVTLVVTFARLTFAVFVHEDTADGFFHRVAYDIFAGNQSELVGLTFLFGLDQGIDLGIGLCKR